MLNGGFESRDLTNWTVTTTLDETTAPGLPAVTTFDVTGRRRTNAAEFEVASTAQFPFLGGGGGLTQTFSTAGGTLKLSGDVAAYAKFGANSDGGAFILFLDDGFVAQLDSGAIADGQIVRNHLTATSLDLTPGSHLFGVLITRPDDFHRCAAPSSSRT